MWFAHSGRPVQDQIAPPGRRRWRRATASGPRIASWPTKLPRFVAWSHPIGRGAIRLQAALRFEREQIAHNGLVPFWIAARVRRSGDNSCLGRSRRNRSLPESSRICPTFSDRVISFPSFHPSGTSAFLGSRAVALSAAPVRRRRRFAPTGGGCAFHPSRGAGPLSNDTSDTISTLEAIEEVPAGGPGPGRHLSAMLVRQGDQSAGAVALVLDQGPSVRAMLRALNR